MQKCGLFDQHYNLMTISEIDRQTIARLCWITAVILMQLIRV
jgi:hypothetical protein